MRFRVRAEAMQPVAGIGRGKLPGEGRTACRSRFAIARRPNLMADAEFTWRLREQRPTLCEHLLGNRAAGLPLRPVRQPGLNAIEVAHEVEGPLALYDK